MAWQNFLASCQFKFFFAVLRWVSRLAWFWWLHLHSDLFYEALVWNRLAMLESSMKNYGIEILKQIKDRMLCCLEERETGPLTADVSVRLVHDMVFTLYTLHCTRVSVRKDKRQISLCTWNPPCSHAMQLCGIGGMMDNSQGQRHNHCFRRFFQALLKYDVFQTMPGWHGIKKI